MRIIIKMATTTEDMFIIARDVLYDRSKYVEVYFDYSEELELYTVILLEDDSVCVNTG